MKTESVAQILSIVGLMYDAALDPSLWTNALEQTADFLNAERTSLVTEDVLAPDNTKFFHNSVADPEWVAPYAQNYMLINPMRLATVTRVRAGDVVLTADFMSADEYGRSRFSREFLAMRNFVDLAVVVIEKTSTRITVLSAMRNVAQGFADDDVRRKLQLLAPHMRRAMTIALLLEQKTMIASTMAATLDGLAAAVFLLDAIGTIVHANTNAGRLLDEDGPVMVVQQRIAFADRAAGASVFDALAKAALGDAELGVDGLSIPAAAPDGRTYIATILPLTNGRRHAIGQPYRAVAAICIKSTAFEILPSAAALAPLHGLTRREMAILGAIIEFDSVPEVAKILGLAESTVKSHLKAIYRKTGATRQGDLVKMVAGANNLLG